MGIVEFKQVFEGKSVQELFKGEVRGKWRMLVRRRRGRKSYRGAGDTLDRVVNGRVSG